MVRSVRFLILLLVLFLIHAGDVFAVAELPQLHVDTTLPTQTGKVITVKKGDNLQIALDSAEPGDTVVLEAGATFQGTITLPFKKNSENKWIIIESSKLSGLPPEGVRVGPEDATNMPKIIPKAAEQAINVANRASYYRLIGIEITDDGKPSVYGPDLPGGGKGGLNYGLVALGDPTIKSISDLPNHIIIDRSYIHGQPTTHAKRGVSMDGAYEAVINSYLSDFHGVGQDTQAISGFNGTGPLKIYNNMLSAAGENILLGGADQSINGVLTRDVEIQRNYFYKPLSWKIGNAQYVGIHWSVKNLLEIKEGERILIDGNVFENSWVDGQDGVAIVLKSVNQGGGAPSNYTSNVTFQSNVVMHTQSGLNICGKNCDGKTSQQGSDIDVKNNVWLDLNATGTCCKGLLTVTGATDGVDVEHNTVFNILGEPITSDASSLSNYNRNLVFKNNITNFGSYGLFIGSGGINTMPGAVVTSNGVVGVSSSVASFASTYKNYPGNFNLDSLPLVGFINNDGSLSGDYSLGASSPWKGKASDGTDLGANWEVVSGAIKGVVSGTPGVSDMTGNKIMTIPQIKKESLIKIGVPVTVQARTATVYTFPSVTSKRKGVQAKNKTGKVIDGPKSQGGYIWWKIDFKNGSDGWVMGTRLK